jgi:hypothetical protein
MTAPTQAEIDRRRNGLAALKQAEADAEAQRATLKASAKAKLKSAEYTPLTEDEADTIVI